jgi:hypothetical protein
LSAEAERILGVTNEQLAQCQPSEVVLQSFQDFIALKYLQKLSFSLWANSEMSCLEDQFKLDMNLPTQEWLSLRDPL